MNITVEDTGPCKKLLKVEVPYEEMKDEVQRVQRTVQRNAAIPGFRAGKAPWNLIEQYYGPTIETEIKHQVVHSVFPKILEEKGLRPVKAPVVSMVDYKKEDGLTFQMDVETAPKFELPQYIGMEIEKKRYDITEEHIEEELRYLQERHAQFEPVETRPVAMGDFIIVDYEIREKRAEALDQAKQVWIEVKEGFFIPKFCEQLVGMKKGEERDIKVALPKEYPKPALSGKKVVVHVRLNEIKNKVVPALNNEFAKEAGDVETLDELKGKIKEQLEAYTERIVQRDMIGQIENYLLTHTELEVPQSVVDSFDSAIYEDTISRLKTSGRATDELIKEKDTEIRAGTRKQAVDQVKLVYILEEIAPKENIDVTDGEIDNRIEEIAKQSGKSPQEIRDYLDKEDKWWDFKYNLRNDKIMNFLLEKANVKEVASNQLKGG